MWLGGGEEVRPREEGGCIIRINRVVLILKSFSCYVKTFVMVIFDGMY